MSGLPVVPLNGLNADSLGTYLASLGLFSLVARKWPTVRAVWRNASFCLVGGPATLERTVEFVYEIGETNGWTPYDRPWDKLKKADVARKSSIRTALWRALEAEEPLLPVFGAHLALDGRIRMNPLLGTGGNAGKRDFAKGWKKAVQTIKEPPRNQGHHVLNNDLKAFLVGRSCTYLDSFQAGSWFGAANKIYNHGNPSAPPNSPRGKKQPYREGKITPWAMALACEGLSYFAGGPSRQLGSRRQPKGAFPFVTAAMAPKGADEAGSVEAEIWAPVWNRPMTVPELKSLFLRGRAELGRKGATSSAAFAVGAMGRGVDAGVAEFRRFLLLHTTSAQTFESRLATVVAVPKTSLDSATTKAIRTIVELHASLPLDRKIGKRWRFSGLCGPLEQALVDLAAVRPGEGCAEQAWSLVDEMNEALVKVDRNLTFRRHNVRFRLLPREWAMTLFLDSPPDRETRLALALSSLKQTHTTPPFIAYRIGVRKRKRGTHWEFSESSPARRIWSDAELTENLGALAERRSMEALQQAPAPPPFDAAIRAGLDDVHAWLTGEVDERRMRLWLDRLSMFDWGYGKNSGAVRELQRSFTGARPVVDGVLALYALFRPLASDWLFRKILQESSIPNDGAWPCANLGRVIATLRSGDVNAAAEIALETYRAAGVALADFNTQPAGPDPDRLLAAFVIPVRDETVLAVFRRWQSPTEPKRE